jgi:uncharacterized protein YecE (DUF72 family)
MGRIRIGISGWRYAGWRGDFYPEGLPQRRELEFAASRLDTIEINGTFYSLQRPELFQRWADDTPDDFVFSVKGSRYLTHMLRLKGVEAALSNFFAQGLFALGGKLGPILWQFPPQMRYDPDRFERFLAALPHDADAAERVARRHDSRLKGRALTKAPARLRLRHAVEIRHDSFACEAFIRQLRRRRAALVVADAVDWTCLFDATADFIYVRLHGSKELYASGYGPKALDRWAERVSAWSQGGEPDGRRASATPAPRRKSRDVFVYFDNDAKVRAPRDAQRLAKMLAQP